MQGAMALLGIATISTSLSGPARPDARGGRAAQKDALRRCITTMGHRHVRVRQRVDRYAHPTAMQGETAPGEQDRSAAARQVRSLFVEPDCRQILPEKMAGADFPALDVGAVRHDAIP